MSKVNLRGLKAAVLNAPHIEVPELSSQLARIGISVSVRARLDEAELRDLDFVFVVLAEASEWFPATPRANSEKRPICVVILESETPTVLERLGRVDVDAVIVKPIRPLGLLAILAHAQSRRVRIEELTDKIARLERKLQGARTVESAKAILATRHGVSPDKAFVMLRQLAMQERVTVEQVAETIVSANRLLAVTDKPKAGASRRLPRSPAAPH